MSPPSLSPPPLIGFHLEEAELYLLLLPHPLYLLLSYLLFSPRSTITLRRNILLITFLPILLFNFGFSFGNSKQRAGSLGLRFFSLTCLLRAVEVGLIHEAPLWVGPVRRDAVGKKEAGKKPVERWGRLVFATSHFYSWRSLGWSTSIPDNLVPAYFNPRPRSRLLLLQLGRIIFYLVSWDAVNSLFNLHPTLHSFDSRLTGYLYDPIPLFDGLVTIPSVIAASLVSLAYVSSISLGFSFYHSCLGLEYTLLHPGKPNPWPPLSTSLWRTTSLHQFWMVSWHQTFRRIYGFLGGSYEFGIGRTGRLIGVFLLIGIHHSATWAFNVNEDERKVAIPFVSYLLFFLLQPLGFLLERLFYRLTARRVGGPLGALWTWSFLLYFGVSVVDAMLKVDAGTGNGCGRDGEEVMPGKMIPFRKAVRFVASRV